MVSPKSGRDGLIEIKTWLVRISLTSRTIEGRKR